MLAEYKIRLKQVCLCQYTELDATSLTSLSKQWNILLIVAYTTLIFFVERLDFIRCLGDFFGLIICFVLRIMTSTNCIIVLCIICTPLL